jgi:flagellar motor component MotA
MEHLSVMHVDKNTLPNLQKRLAIDVVCWVGATAALAWYHMPEVAAVVGATGIMYLRWAFKKYKVKKAQILIAMEMIADMERQLERRANMTEEEIAAEDKESAKEMLRIIFGTDDEDEIVRMMKEEEEKEQKDLDPKQ